MKQKLLGFF